MAVELVNLLALFGNSEIISILKNLSNHFIKSTVGYNLKLSSASFVFTFKKFISNNDIEKLIVDSSSGS